MKEHLEVTFMMPANDVGENEEGKKSDEMDNNSSNNNEDYDDEAFEEPEPYYYIDKRNSLAKRPDVGPLHDSLSMSLSGIYGIFIVVLGAVIPIAETFAVDEYPYAFDMFYVYLYTASLCFLLYVYYYLLRRHRLPTSFPKISSVKQIGFSGLLRSLSTRSTDSVTGKPLRRRRRVSLDPNNHHTGSFYLRLGAIAFGIGSMIHSGLLMGQNVQATGGTKHCRSSLQIITPFLQLSFTFAQLYFIFLNSKMCVNRFKTIGRFGLMHMCATNLCVWFMSIVVETLHAIEHGEHGEHSDHVAHNITDGITRHRNGMHDGEGNHTYEVGKHTIGCDSNSMMSGIVNSAGPFLYPCTIEYSLICAGILYVMWTNVGKGGQKKRHQSSKEYEEQSEKLHKMSVDCTNSSRGLFVGIFITVWSIMCMIGFYVLVRSKTEKGQAVLFAHVFETIMYLLTTIALGLAAFRMRKLRFQINRSAGLEENLILISFTGLQAFAVFSIIAALFSPATRDSGMVIITNLAMIVQSTVQTILLLAGDRMSANNQSQEKKKPGREFVTFLLLCNFAMWMMNTFETQTQEHNPVQLEFYGPMTWSILIHMSVPLGIFYRFHSSVCLSNIWKNAWKLKPGYF
ncbi:hypothetical protein ScPMuIL_007702 [Solemya velum]